MNFRQFVIRNTMRNKHLYVAYFLSTLFAVMVFFTFSTFAFHPALTGELTNSVQTGMLGSAIIIYGFAFFFVLYSMGIFLQSRKKEFGLLMIQGMSPKQLRKMVFIENLVIGFFATLFGSGVGIGFSQLILWISRKLIGVDFGFYFPTKALGLTVVSFWLLFFLISFFIQFSVPKLNVQELLKAGELGKGTIKPSVIKSFLSVVLVIGGYLVALLVPGAGVVAVFLPVVFVVILGTHFLFNQLSVFAIHRLKKRESFFWKKTNMVVFSDLAFRMKDNARSFFLVSVISTVAFAAIGTLYGVQEILLGPLSQSPYAFSAVAEDSNTVKQVDQLLNDFQLGTQRISYRPLNDQGQAVIQESEYNRVATALGEPAISTKGQAVEVKSSQVLNNEEVPTSVTVQNQTYPVSQSLQSTAVLSFESVFVIPDVELDLPEGQEQVFWLVTKGSKEEQIAAGQELMEQGLTSVTAVSFMKEMITKSYAPILFVGIFIGIVFFVSAGSFLYFRLYSDLTSDIEKFKMIFKLGLSKKELKKMVYQQVGILFFTPIVVSFAHGIVALTAMYHIFNLSMQLAGWQVLGTFLLIQCLYYFVARIFYFRKVYQGIQE